MRKRFLVLLLAASGFLCSCAVEPERRPVGPEGSDVSAMPWNRPQQGEGQGMLGNMLNR